MAHFAKLGVNGKVIGIHTLDNNQMLNADDIEDETVGQQRLEEIHGWPAAMWIQTSYNTRKNKYYNADGTEGDQSKALRGNYAGIGYTWNEDDAIFWPPQPHDSWSKNTSTASWEAPITYPTVTTYSGDDSTIRGYDIAWDEDAYQADNTKGWTATDLEDPQGQYEWNTSTLSWDSV